MGRRGSERRRRAAKHRLLPTWSLRRWTWWRCRRRKSRPPNRPWSRHRRGAWGRGSGRFRRVWCCGRGRCRARRPACLRCLRYWSRRRSTGRRCRFRLVAHGTQLAVGPGVLARIGVPVRPVRRGGRGEDALVLVGGRVLLAALVAAVADPADEGRAVVAGAGGLPTALAQQGVAGGGDAAAGAQQRAAPVAEVHREHHPGGGGALVDRQWRGGAGVAPAPSPPRARARVAPAAPSSRLSRRITGAARSRPTGGGWRPGLRRPQLSAAGRGRPARARRFRSRRGRDPTVRPYRPRGWCRAAVGWRCW